MSKSTAISSSPCINASKDRWEELELLLLRQPEVGHCEVLEGVCSHCGRDSGGTSKLLQQCISRESDAWSRGKNL